MNTRSILPALLLAAASFYSGQAAAAVPPLETTGLPALTVCPTTLAVAKAYYSDKIVFAITGQLIAANPDDQPKLNALPRNTELDIKVGDNPKAVADVKAKVLNFLGALSTAGAAPPIRIISVEYAVTVCPKSP